MRGVKRPAADLPHMGLDSGITTKLSMSIKGGPYFSHGTWGQPREGSSGQIVFKCLLSDASGLTVPFVAYNDPERFFTAIKHGEAYLAT